MFIFLLGVTVCDKKVVVPNDQLEKSVYTANIYQWNSAAPAETFPNFHRSKFSQEFGITDLLRSLPDSDVTPLNIWRYLFDDKILDQWDFNFTLFYLWKI